mmetsp:Transcript_46112/g.91091  ORF Transcript_46112/g.91091 Transcript_46112/m.91091 type:complete len:230 (+) Transcript_46112:128-817(+)
MTRQLPQGPLQLKRHQAPLDLFRVVDPTQKLRDLSVVAQTQPRQRRISTAVDTTTDPTADTITTVSTASTTAAAVPSLVRFLGGLQAPQKHARVRPPRLLRAKQAPVVCIFERGLFGRLSRRCVSAPRQERRRPRPRLTATTTTAAATATAAAGKATAGTAAAAFDVRGTGRKTNLAHHKLQKALLLDLLFFFFFALAYVAVVVSLPPEADESSHRWQRRLAPHAPRAH